MKFDSDTLYQSIKRHNRKDPYNEKVHCPLILRIMNDNGSYASFCSQIGIGESTFWNWCNRYPIFLECYELGKMIARANWEVEGEEFKTHTLPLGTIDHAFEYWRMMGWSKFGISKNSRIRLSLSKEGTPAEHYKELLKQASRGDFTASEIKQLMEAINVGLNAHQVFELQKQIDDLKSDLIKLEDSKITDGHNTFSNKGIA